MGKERTDHSLRSWSWTRSVRFPALPPSDPLYSTNLGLGNWPGLFFVRNLLARPVSGEGRSPQGMANSTRHQPSSHATGTYFPSSRKFANATSRQKTWQHATTSQECLSVKNSCRILVVSPPTPPTLHRPQIMANQRNHITPSHSSHRAAFSHYMALRDL